MVKASRSSKKQPAFDPTELTDLIYTPAVGSGVGSHLLDSAPLNVTTVDHKKMSTVVGLDMAIVGESHLATVAAKEKTTVAESEVSTVASGARRVMLWITEEGNLVPDGRVRRIGVARDVMSSAEQSVYDTLWTADPAPVKLPNDSLDPVRVVQAGYDYLVKQTRLSKRTIQRVVEKLIDKDIIAIECRADIYRRSSTVYRVFSQKTILDRHIQRGRFHVAKLGPGFSYVRRLSDTDLQ